jgi:hypothetical protein
MGKDTIAVVFDLGYVLANRGGFGRPFCLLANTDYVPTPNEMRLRFELTRYQPIAAATIAPHSYGAACYQAGGCADIIETVAQRIDARQFNPGFPQPFPRFVQHAIWRYCAQSGLDVCNGNRIDDRKSCNNVYCQIRSHCDRIMLNNTRTQ